MESKELSELQLNHVKQCLDEYRNDLEYIYKRKLNDADKEATDKLIQTLNAEIQFNGLTMKVVLNIQDYWRYVEEGRKPGKFPPIVKIQEWIEQKNILPRQENGKLPTTKSLAFLISRKIANEGIEPGKQLEETMNELNKEYEQKFKDALQEDFNDYSLQILEKINKMLLWLY